jgi:hypothetical protein
MFSLSLLINEAGLFLPAETSNEEEDLLMLLMPMMISLVKVKWS